LSSADCWLSGVDCQVLIVDCRVSIVKCWLLIVRCRLSSADCWLSGVDSQVLIVDCQVLWLLLVPEPKFVSLFRSPGVDSQPGGPVRQPYLTYRPARLHNLAESFPCNRFLGSCKRLQFGTWLSGFGWWFLVLVVANFSIVGAQLCLPHFWPRP
jgi:hypothetical protein